MLNGVVDWLKELTIFMVICETILSFAPTATYKRYIKPFVGLIVLLWITSFLFGAVDIDWSRRVDEIFLDYEQSVSQYLENASVVDADAVYESNNKTAGNISENEDKQKLKEDIIKIDDVIISPIELGGTE